MRVALTLFFLTICSVERAPPVVGDNNTDLARVVWVETKYGPVAFEQGNCPAGRALHVYGELMPDLTGLLHRIVQHGDRVIEVGIVSRLRILPLNPVSFSISPFHPSPFSNWER